MKTVKEACVLQPNALEITVGDSIEQLDQILQNTDGHEHFNKTFITEGMRNLLTKGMARLAAKSNDSIFHLKQAMGGGKTHIMVGFGLLAKDKSLREELINEIPYISDFETAKIAAFNGRNNPPNYFWGIVATQLGKPNLFKRFWENGAKAPDENAWLELFQGDDPILILLDELPPYFNYYATQTLGAGTVADVITAAFSNMLTAAQKKKNVCVVVSDLSAAYETGTNLIKSALNNAKQELGRAEVSITPVNLESNEIYEILRKRLFKSLPTPSEIDETANAFAKALSDAAKTHSVDRTAESIANEISATYPFHPSFKNIAALFKDNEKFKQTRGLMELASRLLKSVWENKEEVYLIGTQHFNFEISDVREKLADISNMREVIAKDIWDSTGSGHAQVVALNDGNSNAMQIASLLLTSSLSTAINSVKGLTTSEIYQFLIDPNHKASSFKPALEKIVQKSWYLHQTVDNKIYYDKQENLTKKLEGYAEKAPQNKVDDIIKERLFEIYKPVTKEAYEKVIPLPLLDEAIDATKTARTLLIVNPDGKSTPDFVNQFYNSIQNKNNVLILTGDKSSIANLENSAKQMYAVKRAEKEIDAKHPQKSEFDEKAKKIEQDFNTTLKSIFDKVIYPKFDRNEKKDVLSFKALDVTLLQNEKFNGEIQIIKTLTSDPKKLYTDVNSEFDSLRSRVEQFLFGNVDEKPKTELVEAMRINTRMLWLPPKGLEIIIQTACQRGIWESYNNIICKKPKPKTTDVVIRIESESNDKGEVKLSVESVNAGDKAIIYYCEDGNVNENCPKVIDNVLVTKALRVQFLAVDPKGKNITGPSKLWENKLKLRNEFDKDSRTVKLLVAPKGTIKYTLDGSEARNGNLYTEPIKLSNNQTSIYVFAECEGLEAKATFTFPAKGSTEIPIVREKPATYSGLKGKKLDNISKIFEALNFAKTKEMLFDDLTIYLGTEPQIINMKFGGIQVTPDFIEEMINKTRKMVSSDIVTLTFKKIICKQGFDLEKFSELIGMEINPGEVVQE